MKNLYLKQNVVLEPLIDNWYVWPHAIPPLTYAMNLKNRNLPILESWIENPEVHAMAVQDPKMLGGPFMDFPIEKKDVVIAHKEKLERENQDLFDLVDQVQELNELLLEHGNGDSLVHLYKKVPEALKGYVELVYDLNNNASFRLFEHLMYQSDYYRKSAQGFKFYETNQDDRPFVLSSPRLKDDGLYLNLPFDSDEIDYIYDNTRTKTKEELIKKLGIEKSQEALFLSYFTETEPESSPKYMGDDIRVRYFGHACVLLETKDVTILVDPVICYDYESKISRYTYKDLPEEIDYVLITHNHLDHISVETMLKLRHKVKNIVIPRGNGYLQDPSLKEILLSIGFENVIELTEFAELKETGFNIKGVPFLGEHSDLNIRCKLCYYVTIGTHKIMFAADTRNLSYDMYDKVAAAYGDLDILFIGMECDGAPLSWLYGPLLPKPINRKFDKNRAISGSNYLEVRSMINSFSPSHVYVYAMGQEPWLNYIMALKYTEESDPIVASNKLLAYCKENNIVSERLFGEKEIKL